MVLYLDNHAYLYLVNYKINFTSLAFFCLLYSLRIATKFFACQKVKWQKGVDE